MKYERPLLTKRETDIVILICKELSDKQIAGELKISIYTVETHENVNFTTSSRDLLHLTGFTCQCAKN
jgi:FixJ family two-component response regulator